MAVAADHIGMTYTEHKTAKVTFVAVTEKSSSISKFPQLHLWTPSNLISKCFDKQFCQQSEQSLYSFETVIVLIYKWFELIDWPSIFLKKTFSLDVSKTSFFSDQAQKELLLPGINLPYISAWNGALKNVRIKSLVLNGAFFSRHACKFSRSASFTPCFSIILAFSSVMIQKINVTKNLRKWTILVYETL